jgi:hypothetical protein
VILFPALVPGTEKAPEGPVIQSEPQMKEKTLRPEEKSFPEYVLLARNWICWSDSMLLMSAKEFASLTQFA